MVCVWGRGAVATTVLVSIQVDYYKELKCPFMVYQFPQ